jgi:uncharacterized cupin superfamily protein
MPNLHDPDWDPPDDAPPPFTGRCAPLGRQAGAAHIGASIYELPPGTAICPLHFHHGDEELAIVISGRPTLRTPDGERELADGEVVAFPRGPAGAHRIDNRGEEPVRVLMVSAEIGIDIVEYPDSGKLLAWAAPQRPGERSLALLFRRSQTVPADEIFEGEP